MSEQEQNELAASDFSSNDTPHGGVSSTSMVGTRVGDYQVMRPLGRGGMSEVYAARDLNLDRDVALKVLRSDLARDKDYVERFRREARAAAKLNHPNIVGVHEVGSVGTTHFIAQELVDGKNLRQHLGDVGQIGAEQAVEILLAVASALQAATELGITHRDIKPENIMLGPKGQIKVADFGLARLQVDSDTSQSALTQAGFALGTPRYMSPEQVQGKLVDARSDLYSLGVTMYHLLAGRPPFDSDDPLALAYSHLNETPKPLDRVRGNDDLPSWLVAIISRLTQKNPKSRFQSPAELLDTLRGDTSKGTYGVGTSSATALLQRAADTARRERRTRWIRGAAMVACPVILFFAGMKLFGQDTDGFVKLLLRPAKVRKSDAVDEQFLLAHGRNDIASWQAVVEYFPASENATNQEYSVKAKLQLALLHESEGRLEKANQILDDIISDPKADLKYRVVAAARRCRVLESLKSSERLFDAKRQFTALYNELRSINSAAIEWFNEVVPEENRAALEVISRTDS